MSILSGNRAGKKQLEVWPTSPFLFRQNAHRKGNRYIVKKEKRTTILRIYSFTKGLRHNFVLALLALFLYYPLRLTSSPILTAIALMLYMTAVMSIGLGVFNLIPVPPLDGSKILLAFLPAKYEYKFAQYEQYIQFILLILLFVGVLDRPINFFINVVYHVLSSIVLLVF